MTTDGSTVLESVIDRSSTILKVSYDTLLENLRVEFAQGTYDFFGVPVEIYHEMIAAESVGKYFQANVKNKYDYMKL